MSYAIHTYFLDKKNHDEAWAYESIQKHFADLKRVKCEINKNPFTKKNILKLKIDDTYSITAFFDEGPTVAEDLEAIVGKKIECDYRLRFLFASDPENNFDDIGVIVLDYLESFKEVIIYSANQEKIIFSPSNI